MTTSQTISQVICKVLYHEQLEKMWRLCGVFLAVFFSQKGPRFSGLKFTVEFFWPIFLPKKARIFWPIFLAKKAKVFWPKMHKRQRAI
jgi:hypothetical protein